MTELPPGGTPNSPWASPGGEHSGPPAPPPTPASPPVPNPWGRPGADQPPGAPSPWPAVLPGAGVPNVTEAAEPSTGQQEYPTAALALAAAPPAKRSDRRRLWTLILVMGFIALCGVAVLVFLGWSG